LTQRFYLNQMRVRAAIEGEEDLESTAGGFMYQDELFLDQALQNLLSGTPEENAPDEGPKSPHSYLVSDEEPNILQAYSAWNKKDTELVN
jgi:hypothetical protein